MAERTLVVDDLRVRYGGVEAVRGLSLEVRPGEIVGLIGANGAGKSSTLHAIMGVAPVTGGDIRLGDSSLRGRRPEDIARDGVALVPEGRRIFGELTVEENLRLGFAARRRGGDTGAALRSVFELFPIIEEFRGRHAGALSGGQQQQLAIARALVAEPDILLLDEPSLGLAPTVVDVVFDVLAAIRERGLGILLVEQRAQRTVAAADRCHVLANGELRLTLGPRPGRRHRRARGGLLLVIGFWNITPQVFADAVALGAVYALMAVGIGLVFGVLRLVNFAYGQLVMAGAFGLALASEWGWPLWAGIVLCFAVVLALSLAMDYLVFRPLRGRTPAVMLVATFAVAFLLQSIALVWFGPLGKIASSFGDLSRPVTISGVDIRKITIVAIVVAIVCLTALTLLLERTTIGLQMRASSMDSQTARLLGVRANRVIGTAVLISGALAAVVAVILTVSSPLVTPDFALRDTIVVLAGVVLGGLNRPLSATLGGFSIGFASGLLGGTLPTDQSQYLPTFLFAAVIVILLVRPAGVFARGAAVERV